MNNGRKNKVLQEVELYELPHKVAEGRVAGTAVIVHDGKRIGTFVTEHNTTNGSHKTHNHPALEFLNKLLIQDPTYDKETWPLVKHGLQENRRQTGERFLFPE